MTHQRPTVGSTEAKLERLHAQLADAVATLVTGDDWVRALEFAARFRSRSFNNTMLIWMQHLAAFEQGRVAEPTPTYVAGFRQWRALGKVGRPRPDRLHDLCAYPRAVRLAHPTGRRVMASSCASRDPETQRRSAHANGRRAARIRVGCLADERCPDSPRARSAVARGRGTTGSLGWSGVLGTRTRVHTAHCWERSRSRRSQRHD